MEKFYEFFEEKKLLVIGGVILVIILLQVCLFYYLNNKIEEKISFSNEKREVLVVEEKEEEKEKVIEVPQVFYVDIKGEVKKPGTYKVEEGKRVIDVINLAGGVTSKADTSVNNLSLKVTDEMVIIIYSKEDVANWVTKKEEEVLKEETCKDTQSSIYNDSCISTDDVVKDDDKGDTDNNDEVSLISINTASKEELMTLPGVGESKALSIIEYREKNGLFNSIEDIKNVSGIGDSLYEQIKDYITT